MDNDLSKYDAPEGRVWVCNACGRSNPNRTRIGDESCFMNASLCMKRTSPDEPWELDVEWAIAEEKMLMDALKKRGGIS